MRKTYCEETHCQMFEYTKKQIRAEAIDECKQILLDAIAKDGKTKCHEYMVAVNEMEQLKEQKNDKRRFNTTYI